MKKEIVISGFGGQGGLAIGKNLAEAGMAEGLNVTWAPSYGPEMRGGTANCSVVLSDKPVGSPVFAHPTELIALNEPSLVKFEEGVVPGGMVFVNSDVVTDKVSRTDLTAYYIPCSQIADEVGNPKVSNMVMLGAYVAGTKVLKAETIEKMIQEMFTGAKAKFVPLNIEAFRRGINNTIEAVLYCKAHGIGAYQGGTCNETDRSAQVCVHCAMATQPVQILAKPGMGVDEGYMIVSNEMNRILALRQAKLR